MKPVAIVAVLLFLAACSGSAPAVQSPSRVLDSDSPANRICVDNSPPAGYGGPVSPYSGSCASRSAPPNVAPAGVHDYSQGMPLRAVR